MELVWARGFRSGLSEVIYFCEDFFFFFLSCREQHHVSDSSEARLNAIVVYVISAGLALPAVRSFDSESLIRAPKKTVPRSR